MDQESELRQQLIEEKAATMADFIEFIVPEVNK
jgi:hypothetical protein